MSGHVAAVTAHTHGHGHSASHNHQDLSMPKPVPKQKNTERASQSKIAHNTSTLSSLDGDHLRSHGQLLVKRIIRHHAFEMAMSIIILLNFAVIISEADMTAERPNGETPDAPVWMLVFGWVTLVIFVVELSMRLYVGGRSFFNDGWNTFDFGVIVVDTTSSLLGLIIGNAIPVSALRILRLCKLTRVSKVFRVFPELRLMIAGLVGSMRSIFWGMVLLLFTLLVWAVIGVQFIHPINLQMVDSYARSGCERCPSAYDSVGHALLTLLKESVAGDSWGAMTVPMVEEHPVAGLYFLGVMMTITMAMLNLILGVVVNVAMQARDEMLTQMEKEKLVMRVEASSHLSQICWEMDKDGSGELSREELFAGFAENEGFRDTLNDLGIEEDDLAILWTILDPDRDGQVTYAEFIHKSFTMKESDQQFMLAYIKYYVTCIRDQVLGGQKVLKECLVGTRDDLHKFEQSIEQSFGLTDVAHRSRSEVDSNGPRPAANVRSEDGNTSLGASRLSDDDRKVLDDLLEKSRQLRDDLNSQIQGVHVRLDSVLQDEYQRLPTRAIAGMPATGTQASDKKSVWCCRKDEPQPRAIESVIGRSYEQPPARSYGLLSTEDVVVLSSREQSAGSRKSEEIKN